VRRPRPAAVALALALALAATAAAAVACGREPGRVTDAPVGPFTLSTPAFEPKGPIPRRYAHEDEGENVSPPLVWRDVPQFTAEIAIVVDDPDASGATPFVHWLVWGARADLGEVPEGLSSAKPRPATYASVREGTNGFDVVGWSGPRPPAGHGPHRYRFTAYALRERLALPAGATKDQLMDAMAGQVVGTAELVGTFERFAR
jgi:Raf kinase inhibitor-like YbhB/YbcL family protein